MAQNHGAGAQYPSKSEMQGDPMTAEEAAFIKEKIAHFAPLVKAALDEVKKEIKGQDPLLTSIATCFLAGGNILAKGPVGVAKTSTVSRVATAFGLNFKRIQCVSDLQPVDILGQHRRNEQGDLEYHPGPVMAQVVHADELNRAPPKTQSAFLQVMEEHQVTIDGETYDVPQPFLLFGTQNPEEQLGTNPLPEAQEDRFMAMVEVGHPTKDAARHITVSGSGSREDVRKVFARAEAGEDLTKAPNPHKKSHISTVLDKQDIILMQNCVRRMTLPEGVVDLINEAVHRLRPNSEYATQYTKDYTRGDGPSPRANRDLGLMVKAHAFMRGELVPGVPDVLAVLEPVLGHRLKVKERVKIEGKPVTVQQVLGMLKADLGHTAPKSPVAAAWPVPN